MKSYCRCWSLSFGSLFYNAFSVTRPNSIDDKVTSEWRWTDKDKHPCIKQDSNPQSQCQSNEVLCLRPLGTASMLVFWVVIPCGLVARCLCSGEKYRLYLQLPTSRHGITTHKTNTHIFTATTTSNLYENLVTTHLLVSLVVVVELV
jgi:hypothetical protein